MLGIGQDLRYGIRSLAKDRSVSLVAIVSLALGIGLTDVVFTLVDAVLLSPLPVPDPGRLVRVGATDHGHGFFVFSYPDYVDLRDGAASLDGLIAHQFNTAILDVDGDPRDTQMELVSGNYFTVLGVRPALGRGFLPEEDRTPGTHPVAVISHRLWRLRFGSDPGVVGRQVGINGHPFTVIGVAPAGFRGTFPGFEVELWLPVMMQEQALPGSGSLALRGDRFLMSIGRLTAGASPDEAERELGAVAARLALAYPDTDEGLGVAVAGAEGVHPMLASVARAFVFLLLGMAVLVLLVACANVATLVLARGAGRRRELAVRAALGAGRGRLVRQLLTESLLLALAGGACGLLLTLWANRLLSAFRPPVGPRIELELGVDFRVLAFSLAVGAGAGIAFGLVPALRASRVDLVPALRGVSSRDGGRGWVRRGLVIAQVAVSALLLVGAGLLARSLLNSRSMDTGFDPRGVLLTSVEAGALGYDEARTRAAWERLERGASAIAGVEAVAWGLFAPLGGRSDQLIVEAADAPPPVGDGRRPLYNYNCVGPGYFALLGIPLLRGRDFDRRDGDGSPDVAIVNGTLAASLWGDGEAVGKLLRTVDRVGRERVVEVVGVARDIKYRSLGEGPTPFLYLPAAQWYRSDLMLHLRVDAGGGAERRAAARGERGTRVEEIRRALRDLVRSLDPDLPAVVSSLDDEAAFSLVPLRLAGFVLGTSGVIGIVLASVGLFGVVSRAASRRAREIGIRMVVGADARDVRRRVIKGSLRLTALGLVAGLGLALIAARLLSRWLYGVRPSDPVTFVAIAFLFLGVAMAASALPARRASLVDPVRLLGEG